MADTNETTEALIAEYRADADKMDAHELPQPTTQYLRIMLDRFEASYKRERQMIIDEANDDAALVKNCATCKHYCRNKKYCPAQDTVNVNPDILPIFRTGPCDKWKCKYTKERHPLMSWEECVAEYQKRKEAGEYGPY